MEIEPIAYMRCDLPGKFGLPRQSGLVEELRGVVEFAPAYAIPAALRGLEEFSHIWLLWGFSAAERKGWSPTVRPPRLGGNARMGVFATRSPYRPNPIGLSCVRLCGLVTRAGRTALEVAGADLMDGTPIYDIKPYLPLTDCRPDASSGFAGRVSGDRLWVEIPEHLLELLPAEKRAGLRRILAGDPRPAYQDDPAREYGFPYAGFEVRFRVAGQTLTVHEIEAIQSEEERKEHGK